MTHSTPRRVLALALLLALLCAAVPALATTADRTLNATIDYKGVWLAFKEEGFQLYVPDGWYLLQGEDLPGLILTDESTTYRMSIETFDGEGLTMDAIYETFAATPTFTGVGILYFGDIPFVSYDMPDQNMFAAVTLSADGSRAYFFKFTPYDDPAFSQLAIKILATLRPAL